MHSVNLLRMSRLSSIEGVHTMALVVMSNLWPSITSAYSKRSEDILASSNRSVQMLLVRSEWRGE